MAVKILLFLNAALDVLQYKILFKLNMLFDTGFGLFFWYKIAGIVNFEGGAFRNVALKILHKFSFRNVAYIIFYKFYL